MRVNRQEVSQVEHNQNTIMSLYRATVKYLSRPDLAPAAAAQEFFSDPPGATEPSSPLPNDARRALSDGC